MVLSRKCISKDLAGSTATIDLPELLTQIHNIEITYEFTLNNDKNGAFVIANIVETLDLTGGISRHVIPNTAINFNFDEDKDNINNLSEVLANSNPFDFPFWTWVAGSDTVDSPGQYGLLGVAAATNLPPARSGAVSWINSGNELCMFGGESIYDSTVGYFGRLNDIWCWDTNNWTWISGSNTANAPGNYGVIDTPNTSNIPGARKDAVSWVDDTGQLWLFGGSFRSGLGLFDYYNDLWLWDVINWTWKSGSSAKDALGVYVLPNLPGVSYVPGARSGSVSWVDSKNRLWLFGGFGIDDGTNLTNQLLNDLWYWDGSGWNWILGSKTGNAIGNYGVKGQPGYNNVPGARSGAVSWVDSKDNLWLFGGYGNGDGTDTNGGPLNDLWRWDSSTRMWTWVAGDKTVNSIGTYLSKGVIDSTSQPGGRSSANAWVDSNDHLWLFGGYGSDDGTKLGYLNDLWRWDGNFWIWESGSRVSYESSVYGSIGIVSPSNVLGARRDAVSWIDSYGRFLVFGGFIVEDIFLASEFHLNDLWRLELK